MGIFSDSVGNQFQQESLGFGDHCLLFSDGIIEACNAAGEMFGESRLVELIEKSSIKELIRLKIKQILQQFQRTKQQSDYITLHEYIA